MNLDCHKLPGMDTADLIAKRLSDALAPETIEVIDDSHKHRGHAGAAEGGGHFRVRLVSSAFDGLSQLARHRCVYEVLDSEMGGLIHALSIVALAPGETAGDNAGDQD